PEAWWAVLRARLEPAGVRWSDATTPRQAAELISGQLVGLPPRHGHESEVVEAVAAVEALVRALEAERYSPRPPEASSSDLQAWVDAVVQPLTAATEPELVGAS